MVFAAVSDAAVESCNEGSMEQAAVDILEEVSDGDDAESIVVIKDDDVILLQY